MRLRATDVGFFEDYDDSQMLEVGFRGVDGSGAQKSFSIQRTTYPPEEQDVQYGMDSYNVSTERGMTLYGCLRRVHLSDTSVTLDFVPEDAAALEISNPVEIDLTGAVFSSADLGPKLSDILVWGAQTKRPELAGPNFS